VSVSVIPVAAVGAKALLQPRNYAIMASLEPRLPECVLPGALPEPPSLGEINLDCLSLCLTL